MDNLTKKAIVSSLYILRREINKIIALLEDDTALVYEMLWGTSYQFLIPYVILKGVGSRVYLESFTTGRWYGGVQKKTANLLTGTHSLSCPLPLDPLVGVLNKWAFSETQAADLFCHLLNLEGSIELFNTLADEILVDTRFLSKHQVSRNALLAGEIDILTFPPTQRYIAFKLYQAHYVR
jgi:hypothetical protein